MKDQLLINPNIGMNNFDIIRFVLASSVVLCHSYVIYYQYDLFVQREPFMKWSQGQTSIGSFAVNFFFIISGFLIIKSFESSSNLWDYLKKRVLRIYPGFIVVFILSIFLFAAIGSSEWIIVNGFEYFFNIIPLKKELARLLALKEPVGTRYFPHLPQKGLNDSLWTIQFEFICYLLVPVLGVLSILKRRTWLLVILIVCYSLYFVQYYGYIFPFNGDLNGQVLGNPYFYPRFFTYFLMGSCFYLYRERIVRNHLLAVASLGLIVFAFVGYKSVEQVLPIAGTYLLFYLAYHPRLQYPAFSKWGDFSYGIYLYGWPVQQLAMLFFWQHLSPVRLFAVVFPIILALAYFSWTVVESPALKLKKRMTFLKSSGMKAENINI